MIERSSRLRSRLRIQVIPTHNYRHSTKIREGKQSSEVFCKNNKRREELGLPPISRDY
jgi:hypothetical protein